MEGPQFGSRKSAHFFSKKRRRREKSIVESVLYRKKKHFLNCNVFIILSNTG